MKAKINLKKILGSALVIYVAHQIGQVVGGYKVLSDINDSGVDDPRIKDGLDAAKSIREETKKLKEDFASTFLGKKKVVYDDPDPEEEDEFCAECAEVRPTYDEAWEEDESSNIEMTTNDQPED